MFRCGLLAVLVLPIACSLRDVDYLTAGSKDAGAADGASAVGFLTDVRSIHAGVDTTCATLSTGALYCWGNNIDGQLGQPPGDSPERDEQGLGFSARPVQVRAVREAKQAAGTALHNCVIVAEGRVWCWGSNRYGGLGRGVDAETFGAPLEVQSIDRPQIFRDATSISGGGNTFCTVVNAEVYCWGQNTQFHAGFDDGRPTVYPWLVVSEVALPGAVEVGVGMTHSCARLLDGGVSCWGSSMFGKLGGARTTAYATRVDLGDRRATQLAVGNHHSCILTDKNIVTCWGRASEGQTGVPTGAPLRDIDFGAPIRKIALGGSDASAPEGGTTCALFVDGRVACMGSNDFGQLGLGERDANPHPASDAFVRDVSDAIDVSVGAWHACVVTSERRAKCWGTNGRGELGDGTREDRPAPAWVVAPRTN